MHNEITQVYNLKVLTSLSKYMFPMDYQYNYFFLRSRYTSFVHIYNIYKLLLRTLLRTMSSFLVSQQKKF
jgi:hypothetical protein